MDNSIWKWLGFAVPLPIFFSLVLYLADLGNAPAFYCGSALGGLMVIFAIQAWAGFRAYYRQVEVDQYAIRASALANTSDVRRAEAMQSMHPQTAAILLQYEKTIWLIEEANIDDVCEWWLRADPRINARFVEWVLENSNEYTIMPQHNRISDKTFTWSKTVSDRVMYKLFCDLLVARRMLTAGYGVAPGSWVQPWNPRRVGKRFGILLSEPEPQVDAAADDVVEQG